MSSKSLNYECTKFIKYKWLLHFIFWNYFQGLLLIYSDLWLLLYLLLLICNHSMLSMKHCMDMCMSIVVHFLCWEDYFKSNNIRIKFLYLFLFIWLDYMDVLWLLICMCFYYSQYLSLSWTCTTFSTTFVFIHFFSCFEVL